MTTRIKAYATPAVEGLTFQTEQNVTRNVYNIVGI